TMTAEAKNGMRQPHSMKGPLVSPRLYPSAETRIKNRPLARKKPNGAPNCGHMAADARLPSSAVSDASRAAPDHSPPRPRPWQSASVPEALVRELPQR